MPGALQLSLCKPHLCIAHCSHILESARASLNAILKDIISNEQFKNMNNMNRFIIAVYAPVEHIFSHCGIFMHPHRAHMSDNVLCDLVFTKCNAEL